MEDEISFPKENKNTYIIFLFFMYYTYARILAPARAQCTHKHPLIFDFCLTVKVELQKLTTKDVAGFEDTAMLTCRVKRANPLPTMVWYFQAWRCTTAVCTPNDQGWTTNFAKVSSSVSPRAFVALCSGRTENEPMF